MPNQTNPENPFKKNEKLIFGKFVVLHNKKAMNIEILILKNNTCSLVYSAIIMYLIFNSTKYY